MHGGERWNDHERDSSGCEGQGGPPILGTGRAWPGLGSPSSICSHLRTLPLRVQLTLGYPTPLLGFRLAADTPHILRPSLCFEHLIRRCRVHMWLPIQSIRYGARLAKHLMARGARLYMPGSQGYDLRPMNSICFCCAFVSDFTCPADVAPLRSLPPPCPSCLRAGQVEFLMPGFPGL